MTAMDEALRRDSLTLAELARRYDGPVDLGAVGVLHLLMENADLVHTGHGPLLIIPTTIALIDEINDVLSPLEDDEPDDPAEDDDPGGDVLDAGEADYCDDEDDGTAEHDSRDAFHTPMRSGTLDSFHPALNRHVATGAEHLPMPEQAQGLADDTGEPVLARSGLMYKPREREGSGGRSS